MRGPTPLRTSESLLRRKSPQMRIARYLAIILLAAPVTPLRADVLVVPNAIMRYLGWGWSKGYHAPYCPPATPGRPATCVDCQLSTGHWPAPPTMEIHSRPTPAVKPVHSVLVAPSAQPGIAYDTASPVSAGPRMRRLPPVHGGVPVNHSATAPATMTW